MILTKVTYGDRVADWWPQYVKRVGAPRVVPCDIDVGGPSTSVWVCSPHQLGFATRDRILTGLGDRCPASRLEEWRARRWEAADALRYNDLPRMLAGERMT